MKREQTLKKIDNIMEYMINNNLDINDEKKSFNEFQELLINLLKSYKDNELVFITDKFKNEIYFIPEMVENIGLKYLEEWKNDYVPDTLENLEYKYFNFDNNKYFVYGNYQDNT